MGIDNDSILVYGWVFEHDDFLSMFNKIMQKNQSDDDDEEKMLNIIEEYLNSENPETFNVGYASPYYDSSIEDHNYYISFNISDMSHDKIYELMKLHHETKLTKYPILKEVKIFELPMFHSLPHVW